MIITGIILAALLAFCWWLYDRCPVCHRCGHDVRRDLIQMAGKKHVCADWKECQKRRDTPTW